MKKIDIKCILSSDSNYKLNAMTTQMLRTTRRVLRCNYSKNALDIPCIESLHKDFDKIHRKEDNDFQMVYSFIEIPPPFCFKCNQNVTNKCQLSSDKTDIDLSVNPSLMIQCPIFGEINTKIASDNFED